MKSREEITRSTRDILEKSGQLIKSSLFLSRITAFQQSKSFLINIDLLTFRGWHLYQCYYSWRQWKMVKSLTTSRDWCLFVILETSFCWIEKKLKITSPISVKVRFSPKNVPKVILLTVPKYLKWSWNYKKNCSRAWVISPHQAPSTPQLYNLESFSKMYFYSTYSV